MVDYSTDVAQSACKDAKVTEAFSELLEEAIAQPNVTEAIQTKLDLILASRTTQDKFLAFFTKLLKSEEVKSALHEQLADEEMQQKISESFIISLKRLLPWGIGAQHRAETRRAEMAKANGKFGRPKVLSAEKHFIAPDAPSAAREEEDHFEDQGSNGGFSLSGTTASSEKTTQEEQQEHLTAEEIEELLAELTADDSNTSQNSGNIRQGIDGILSSFFVAEV